MIKLIKIDRPPELTDEVVKAKTTEFENEKKRLYGKKII